MFSKTFALDNYFMHIPERLLDEGRAMLSEKDLLQAVTTTKGLWTISWQENALSVETEVLIGRKNVNGYSCDCEIFQNRKMCAHIAAGLHHISGYLESENARKKSAPKKDFQPNSKIPLKQIIECLSEKELTQFIFNQASKNALLAGELKTRYAYKVVGYSADDKYYTLIRKYASALSPGKLTAQKFKRLRIYLEDLVDHGEDLISIKNYRESFLILMGLIRYLAIGSSSYHQLDWHSISFKIHSSLDKLFLEQLPVEFKKEIIKKLRGIYHAEPYHILDGIKNLYSQLFAFADAQNRGVYLELQDYNRRNPQNQAAQVACWNMAAKIQDLKQLEGLATDHIQNLPLLQKFLTIFSREKDQNILVYILKYIMAKSLGPRVQNWAFEQLVLAESNPANRITHYLDHIVKEGNLHYVIDLKKEAGKAWTETFRILVDRAKKIGNEELLIDLLVIDQDRQSVLDFFEKNPDVKLLLKYAKFVWEADKNFLKTKLQVNIGDHLTKHIGHQSAGFILEVFKKLSANRLNKLKDDLLKMILHDFSERKHLIKLLKDQT